MNKLFLHIYYRFLELSRQPTYLVTSLIFPSMFFWFFGVPNAKTLEASQLLMASFSSFAVLGVVLFQVAIGFAQERSTPWSGYVRTLPVSPMVATTAQLMTNILFSSFAVLAVILVAYSTTEVSLPSTRWAPFLLSVFLGGIPFATLGMLIGLLCSPKSAIPVANLVYLPLSFAGGLWIPPNALPKLVQDISDYLPTRMYAEVVWSGIFARDLKRFDVWGLCLYFAVFFALSIYLYRRDEGQRYQ